MLNKKFFTIWFAGRLDDKAVEKLRRKLAEALARREQKVLLRFYLDEGSRESYYDALRRILLSNVALSVVVEERPAPDLQKDLEKPPEGGITLILGKGAPSPPRGGNIVIEEVGEDA